MRVSVWHRTEVKQPDKSGYYLGFRGFGISGMADGDSEYGYVYYDQKRNVWREYKTTNISEDSIIVYYWTDAQPEKWTDEDPSSVELRKQKKENNPALELAWQEVEKALRQYDLIRRITK